ENIYALSKWDISGAAPVEVWHISLDAAPPHFDDANALNAQATNFNGLALDESRGRIFVTRKNAERPLHNVLSYDMETGDFRTSFAAAESVVGGDITDLPGGGGNSIRDVGVDAAGNVIGYIWTSVSAATAESSETTGMIEMTGVLPSQRGRGVGSAVIAAGLRHLRERGAGVIVLEVDDENVSARRIYRDLGFKKTGEQFWYEKKLAG
ncbi:MAG: GNAT family N-acetyltransferase, partial [Chloroflexi bacterium]|nr:GNAT family N-acetyltransferase [Chloroflexota bacterium]